MSDVCFDIGFMRDIVLLFSTFYINNKLEKSIFKEKVKNMMGTSEYKIFQFCMDFNAIKRDRNSINYTYLLMYIKYLLVT